MSNRLLGYLALVAGTIGLIACLAVLIYEWRAAARVHRVAEQLFSAAEDSLDEVHDKIDLVAERVAAMNLTTSDIVAGLKDRTADEIRERLTTELKLEERSAQLANGVEQADQWAGVIESSVESARSLVELLKAAGIDVDTAGIDGVLEEVTAVRTQLNEAGDQVAAFRQRIDTTEEHDGQLVTLVARVAATLTSLDERIGKFGDRLSLAQESIDTAERKSQRCITTASVVAALLLVWLAAGQAALVYVGWKNVRAG